MRADVLAADPMTGPRRALAGAGRMANTARRHPNADDPRGAKRLTDPLLMRSPERMLLVARLRWCRSAMTQGCRPKCEFSGTCRRRAAPAVLVPEVIAPDLSGDRKRSGGAPALSHVRPDARLTWSPDCEGGHRAQVVDAVVGELGGWLREVLSQRRDAEAADAVRIIHDASVLVATIRTTTTPPDVPTATLFELPARRMSTTSRTPSATGAVNPTIAYLTSRTSMSSTTARARHSRRCADRRPARMSSITRWNYRNLSRRVPRSPD
jgi:hypothetical protein